MTVTEKKTYIFWGAVFLTTLIAFYFFKGILLPFIIAFILAYIFDPLVDRLQRLKLSRFNATMLVLIIVIVIIVIALFFLLPLLATQLSDFIKSLPSLIKSAREFADGQIAKIKQTSLAPYISTQLQNGQSPFDLMINESVSIVARFLGSVWTGGQAIFSALSIFVIAPIIGCYLLYDWDKMIKAADALLPCKAAPRIRTIFKEIDSVLSAYLRGQASICILLGVIYAIGLATIGLNFSLLIGITAGLLSFLPYIGNIIGLTAALLVALSQFGADYVMLLAVVAVFVIGQILDAYVLQPKLIGSAVGLHPVWLFFALFASGAVFGFFGILLAVPLAASIAVCVRHMMQDYKASSYYKG